MYEYITVEVGDTEEFFRCLASLAYLEYNYQKDIYFHIGLDSAVEEPYRSALYAHSKNPIKNYEDFYLKEQMEYILYLYKPIYVGQDLTIDDIVPYDSNNIFNIGSSSFWYTIYEKEWMRLLPTARERIEAKNWLKKTLILRSRDNHLIESLFKNT